jgi:hypothetical protein
MSQEEIKTRIEEIIEASNETDYILVDGEEYPTTVFHSDNAVKLICEYIETIIKN